MRNTTMLRSLHSRTANRPERSEATQRPWRLVVLSDGSRNVFGGSDGQEFVCTTGFGGQSESDALHIVALANVIHEGGETPDIDLDATLALLDKMLAGERAEAKHHRVVMAEWPVGSETRSEASKAALRADRDAHLAKTLLSALPSLLARDRERASK